MNRSSEIDIAQRTPLYYISLFAIRKDNLMHFYNMDSLSKYYKIELLESLGRLFNREYLFQYFYYFPRIDLVVSFYLKIIDSIQSYKYFNEDSIAEVHDIGSPIESCTN